eukprot:Rmarinus@m.11822
MVIAQYKWSDGTGRDSYMVIGLNRPNQGKPNTFPFQSPSFLGKSHWTTTHRHSYRTSDVNNHMKMSPTRTAYETNGIEDAFLQKTQSPNRRSPGLYSPKQQMSPQLHSMSSRNPSNEALQRRHAMRGDIADPSGPQTHRELKSNSNWSPVRSGNGHANSSHLPQRVHDSAPRHYHHQHQQNHHQPGLHSHHARQAHNSHPPQQPHPRHHHHHHHHHHHCRRHPHGTAGPRGGKSGPRVNAGSHYQRQIEKRQGYEMPSHDYAHLWTAGAAADANESKDVKDLREQLQHVRAERKQLQAAFMNVGRSIHDSRFNRDAVTQNTHRLMQGVDMSRKALNSRN